MFLKSFMKQTLPFWKQYINYICVLCWWTPQEDFNEAFHQADIVSFQRPAVTRPHCPPWASLEPSHMGNDCRGGELAVHLRHGGWRVRSTTVTGHWASVACSPWALCLHYPHLHNNPGRRETRVRSFRCPRFQYPRWTASTHPPWQPLNEPLLPIS